MRYDENQRQAIGRTTNVVVRAGAGAGKTSVLVERYVRLVARERIPVDEILTLTFTRKAASEMHERIYRALAAAATGAGDTDGEPDRAFIRTQLQRFNAAVITTLDSFCGTVARSGCAAFGVAPTFTVDEAQVHRFCDELALRFLLERSSDTASPADRAAVHSLVGLNRFGPLWHDGFAGLARDHFLVSREFDLPQMVEAQRRYLVTELGRRAGRLSAALGAIARLNGGEAGCIARGAEVAARADRASLDSETLMSAVSGGDGRSPLSAEGSNHLNTLVSVLDSLSGIKKNCGSSRKPAVVEYKERAGEVAEHVKALRDIATMLRSWHESAGAVDLAATFQTAVGAQKRATGVLSYHDVSVLAIGVLTRNHELRAYYKDRFKAIMIDEFQDNNEEQKELLYLLAERTDRVSDGIPAAADLDPGKLFFVGDEKQSIYRFRGADVSVFKSLAGELGGEEAAVTLGGNYRSEPGLIRFFNAFFPLVFDDPDPPYEAAYEALGARDAVPGVVPTVNLWRLASRDGNPDLMDDNEAEAFHIARFISEAVTNGTLAVSDPVGDAGTPPVARPATYRDIAILMRSTGNQMTIERMLRLMDVPYVSQTARSLFLEAPLNDIYNALQLTLYPGDRVAFAAFLRSPLVGISDAGLVRALAVQSRESSDPLSVPVPGLSTRDEARYCLARQRIGELSALADTVSLTDLLHHIWFRWGYRYHLLKQADYVPYLEHYDYIYELARAYEDRGLAEFLRTIRRNMGSNERLDDITVIPDSGEGVAILTIHRAKGLEFPVVIVAGTGSRGRTDSITDAPFHWSDSHGLVFNVSGGTGAGEAPKPSAVNVIFRQEREQKLLEERAELRRLLYVAATRAKAHLFFVGRPRGEDRSLIAMITPPFQAAADQLEGDPGLAVALRDLDPVPRNELRAIRLRREPVDITELAREYSASPVVRREFAKNAFAATELNAKAVEMELVPVAAVPGARDIRPAEPPAGREGTALSGVADLFGTFTHYCLQQIGAGRASAASLRRPALVPLGMRPDLPAGEVEAFAAEGVELAERFFGSDLWSRSAEAVRREFEMPFVLQLAGNERPTWIRGTIDLVMEFTDSVLVVDFKTDRELVPEHYAVQLELYRRGAAAIFGKATRSVLYHLPSGTVVPMDTSVPDDMLAQVVDELSGKPATSTNMNEAGA